MNDNIPNISFKDILEKLKFASTVIIRPAEIKPIESIISPLIKICSDVGSSKPYKPLYVPEEYKQQWKDYLAKGGNLESRAVRYLCWETEVASDKRFLQYLERGQITLSTRSLQGIVRACHWNWKTVIQESYLKKGSLLGIVKNMVVKYQGPNRILQKWKSSINNILTPEGPQFIAAEMVKDSAHIKEYSESWGIDIQSQFFKDYTMVQNVERCMSGVKHYDYLFSELLSWPLWGNTEFKKMVSDLILDNSNSEDTREKLQHFILSDSRLGDPRLPRDKRNWIDMNAEAKARFIQWLCGLDIGFFFKHVLPDGNDPHGRKDFWLKYLKHFRATRPMLCDADEKRLENSSLILEGKIKSDNWGKITTPNSVFLLDFGTVVAVEFSIVGASYIYTAEVFKRMLPDFFTKKAFSEGYFKHPKKCIARIIHSRSDRWKREMANVLSQNGVRPEGKQWWS